ncbi:antibiotic biosynthesis monooxygenase [Rhodococcus sp. 14C212]|uniref:putative quinol monooxygenase n=1 Tax=Rhodococcus sp. 14C212 TaxID=2711209 RepID=UPI0013EB289A|nr:putative quinol monooxygenase [Rhodococcus sp. 14C212]NGP07659.1 antibiotic biosynthesis monooxygenase [Rhodococcus sp. 14C212]
MTELRVVATISAKPGSEDAVRGALVALAAASRDEDGCVSYELFESASAPGTFVTVEVWTGQEALDAHMTSRHVTSALATVGEHLAAAPVIHPLTAVA